MALQDETAYRQQILELHKLFLVVTSTALIVTAAERELAARRILRIQYVVEEFMARLSIRLGEDLQ